MCGLREYGLRWKTRSNIDDEVLHSVMCKYYLSDWFILTQVGKICQLVLLQMLSH